jgi:hydrogenase nickel incorporation protein HypB
MQRVELGQKVLSENTRLAAALRRRFHNSGTLCLNLVSSPGSGKTSLLEQTLARLPKGSRVAILTGDLQTENDAIRLRRFGYPVKQITTGGTCHLDARMIDLHLQDWRLEELEILFIENVGNLVCPSSYDLGEAAKVVLLSVTEGDDKPLKYPSIFFRSELVVINKVDLSPYVSFDLEKSIANARKINPTIQVLKMSCSTGEGLDAWLEWIEHRRKNAAARACALSEEYASQKTN